MPGGNATGHGIHLTQVPCICAQAAGFGRGAFPPICRLWGLEKMLSAPRFEAFEARRGSSAGTVVTVLQGIMTDGGHQSGGLAGKSKRSGV